MSNTWIELDLSQLRRNIGALRTALGSGTETIFVVKANAYGHGLVPVVETAWSCGIRWFAVFHLEEALELRELLPASEILMLGVTDPLQAPIAARANLIVTLGNEQHAAELAKALNSAAGRGNGRLRCHVKVDTGMGRLGLLWRTAPRIISEKIMALHRLKVEGICSHFSSADCPDRSFAELQTRRFRSVISACRKRGLQFRVRHIANSGGVMCGRASDFDAVRVGILLYGYGPQTCGENNLRVNTHPFLQWKTRIVLTKRVPEGYPISYGGTYRTRSATTIGLLEVGYADGYFRCLGNRGAVLAGGRRRPVIGRVTMNLTMIDLGPKSDVQVGEEAVLVGEQGQESVWAGELAAWCNTIPYEILTSIRTADRRIVRA